MSLWRPAFWRSCWIALRRSKGDKRSRLIALKISFLLLCVLIYVLFWLLPLREPGGAWRFASYVAIFASALLTRFLLNRSKRRQDEMLSYSLTGSHRLTPEGTAYVSQTVRNYLEERALILGSLVARATSEIYLHHIELGPRTEVATRQTQNALLRQAGLWDKLERPEMALIVVADGHWTEKQQSEVATWCEQLRLLRWVLGIDAELIPLAHFPKIDMELSRGLLGNNARVPENRTMLRSLDVRIERDIAFAYTARVVAELKGRGLIAADPELEGWADQLREQSLGASNDFLAGTRTVGELGDEALRMLGTAAVARERYTAYLVDQLSAEKPFSFATWSERH
jgi:hypothetical protein